MFTDYKVESGLQLLARLTKRPCLSGVYKELLPDGPNPSEVVEIVGQSNVGKSLLLLEIIYRTLLPLEFGGKGSGVIFIDTDGNFNFKLLLSKLKESIDEEESQIYSCVMKNFVVIQCNDSYQLRMNLHRIDSIVTSNQNISLVAIDSLTAFYWSDQSLRISKMDSYSKSILGNIQKTVKDYKLVICFTKQAYFGTKLNGADISEACVLEPVIEKVNYKIFLTENVDEKYSAEVTWYNGKFSRYYKIENNQIVWIC